VVLTQDPKREKQIRSDISKFSELFLSFGCMVILRTVHTSRDAISGILRNRIFAGGLTARAREAASDWQDPDGDPPIPHARILADTASWQDVANFLVENPAGPPPNINLEILVFDGHGNEYYGPCFASDCELLIRRAFFNCTKVHLEVMPGGRSGLGVFRTYAELAKGQSPMSFPLPYFVKIGRRQRITDEYHNYEDWVDPYIPFHLGPHLIRERCCLGAHNGILVGDYVEASESLLDAARNGRALSAIACLFDKALHGWYRGAEIVNEPITAFIRLPLRLRDVRINRARQLGGKIDLDELRAFFDRCNTKSVLIGPIHGDLHGENVRVRGNDAILIDFTERKRFPLVCDVASLEASFLIEGFSDTSHWDAQRWLDSVKPLYEGRPLSTAPPHANPRNPVYWFYEVVRQLRHYAQRLQQPDSNQYAAALAVALIVKANKDPLAPEPEASRRAGALVLAERVLTQTFAPRADDDH
jgi:hypothetical protein